MGFDITGLGAAFDFGSKLIDKFIPDKNEAEKAKIQLLQMQQSGELAVIDKQVATITSEANSNDKWTSRARPSFLYVFYVLILFAIPFGVLYIVNPIAAESFKIGISMFWTAIPDQIYWLFGTGYLGYTGARTFEKLKVK